MKRGKLPLLGVAAALSITSSASAFRTTADVPGYEQQAARWGSSSVAFYLHADGKVYHRQRTGDGDRRIDNEEIVALVHREYRILTDQYRQMHSRRERRARLLALFAREVDTTKREAL